MSTRLSVLVSGNANTGTHELAEAPVSFDTTISVLVSGSTNHTILPLVNLNATATPAPTATPTPTPAPTQTTAPAPSQTPAPTVEPVAQPTMTPEPPRPTFEDFTENTSLPTPINIIIDQSETIINFSWQYESVPAELTLVVCSSDGIGSISGLFEGTEGSFKDIQAGAQYDCSFAATVGTESGPIVIVLPDSGKSFLEKVVSWSGIIGTLIALITTSVVAMKFSKTNKALRNRTDQISHLLRSAMKKFRKNKTLQEQDTTDSVEPDS